MTHVLAGLILAVWFIMVLSLEWDKKYSKLTNVVYGILIYLFLGVIYLIPFWLIFLN